MQEDCKPCGEACCGEDACCQHIECVLERMVEVGHAEAIVDGDKVHYRLTEAGLQRAIAMGVASPMTILGEGHA